MTFLAHSLAAARDVNENLKVKLGVIERRLRAPNRGISLRHASSGFLLLLVLLREFPTHDMLLFLERSIGICASYLHLAQREL